MWLIINHHADDCHTRPFGHTGPIREHCTLRLAGSRNVEGTCSCESRAIRDSSHFKVGAGFFDGVNLSGGGNSVDDLKANENGSVDIRLRDTNRQAPPST
jgi:hypothetical protein